MAGRRAGSGPTTHRGWVALGACALAFALGSCGGDDEDATAQEPSAAPSSPGGVEIVEFAYDPETITVAAGDEVEWVNSDDAPHTATADDSSFDTGRLARDDAASVAFDEPGTFTYYCRYHAFMKGTVEVE